MKMYMLLMLMSIFVAISYARPRGENGLDRR